MSFTPATEAARLAGYLRQNPTAIHDSAEDLAEMAQVSLILAKKAITKPEIDASGQVTSGKRYRPKNEWKAIAPVRAFWLKITENPYLFIIITMVIAFAIGRIFEPLGAESSRGGSLRIDGPLASSLVAITWISHLACFFRHGKVRVVILSSLLVSGTVMGLAILSSLTTPNGDNSTGEIVLIAILGFIVFALIYSLFGSFFSVIGAFVRIKADERNKDAYGRQELLELLFDIEDRLQRAGDRLPQGLTWRDHPIIVQIATAPFTWAITLGFGLSLIGVLLATTIMSRMNVALDSPQVGIAMGILSLIILACQIGVSYLAGSVQKAVLVCLTLTFCTWPANFLPFPGFGFSEFVKNLGDNTIPGLVFSLIVGLLAGIGAALEQRKTEEKLLLQNDPETLLAEFLDIQRRLNPGPRDITVMVVDAAKSSIMKSMADPFIAEWSFRAYQQLLERVAAEFEGEVLSTAGDGAIITFRDTRMAMLAAWRTHDRIAEFNAKTNKLSMPFKLRIGVHKGMVIGQIDKVQYTDVIDIAAHVEAACLVGGVTVTEPVWATLSTPKGDRLSIAIDSFTVYQLETGSI